jgi:hypothetical protein
LSKQYGVRLSEKDAKILEQLADADGLTTSEFIRKYLRSLSPQFKGEVKPVGYPKGRKRKALENSESLSKALDELEREGGVLV